MTSAKKVPRIQVPKSESYMIRLRPGEKQLFQQAAARAGLGTAEYWSSVLTAVSYAVMKVEPGEEITPEYLEKIMGSHVASVVYPGLVRAQLDTQEKSEEEKNEK